MVIKLKYGNDVEIFAHLIDPIYAKRHFIQFNGTKNKVSHKTTGETQKRGDRQKKRTSNSFLLASFRKID